MTDPISQSEPTTDEPAVNGPSEAAEPAVVPPTAPPAEDAPPPESAVIDKIRSRVRASRADADADRMRTLEDRLLKLEELLTAKITAAPAVSADAAVPEAPPVAAIAPPVAPLIAEAPVAQVVAPPPSPPPAASSTVSRSWRTWFLIQSLSQGFSNFRLFLRMYVDPRYKMTWLGRVVPLAFLVFFICSDLDWSISNFIFFWNLIPIAGPMINKLILIAFAWVTVKVLAREMRRYQQVIPDVPEAIRWNNS